MNNLWNQRLNKYQKKLLKYLRFVFNDHFIIALFFILGAACYGYFILIDNYITKYTFQDKLVAVIILYLFLQIGKIATLLSKPDIVFLLPKDYEINKYLKCALKHSFFINTIMQGSLVIIVVPFLVRVLGFNIVEWIVILISQIILKYSLLLLKKFDLFNTRWTRSTPGIIVYYILPLLAILCGIFFSSWLELIISIGLIILTNALQNKIQNNHIFKWNQAIELEESRVRRIYKFFSLFTYVPEVSETIKERKYLDFLLPKYSKDQNKTYLYLYWRGFWRNPEYSGIFIRLTLISLIIGCFVNLYWLSILLILLFIYLTGFQLLPLYNQYSDNIFTHLYPLNEKIREKNFKNVLLKILIVQILILTIVIFIKTMSIIKALIFIALAMIIMFFLIKVVLKRQLIKMA
ncbi:ABC transporter permease [Ligilactobacillus cholophilus]|uniref:ABC transporter permease n=1 Tax=Ligilactobacillus cholophilus TaxID=3050131 RepID=UPI0025B138C8|nr:ABC transporter permease [Ligilactobacillus cholophilus]